MRRLYCFIFCMLVAIPQLSLAGNETPGSSSRPIVNINCSGCGSVGCGQLSFHGKHTIVGASLLISGVVVVLASYFPSLIYRCPGHSGSNDPNWHGTVYCCALNSTGVPDTCVPEFSNCDGNLKASCLDDKMYVASTLEPSDLGIVGITFGSVALIAGSIWTTIAGCALIFGG